MREREPFAPISPTAQTEPLDAERAVEAPHFDAAAVRHAQPAVPLAEIRARRKWPFVLISLAVLAGLIGGVIGGALSNGYLKQDSALPATQREVATSDVKPSDESAEEAPPTQPTSDTEVEEQVLPSTIVESEIDDSERAVENRTERPQAGETRNALRNALGEWLAATNARDLDKQLSFYPQTMNSFYRRRNARLEEVRADRARVFERASSIDVRAGDPRIEISPDGNSARMYFRKRYTIAGGGEDRSGEVLQELRWRRVNGKWRIISERDVKVIQ